MVLFPYPHFEDFTLTMLGISWRDSNIWKFQRTAIKSYFECRQEQFYSNLHPFWAKIWRKTAWFTTFWVLHTVMQKEKVIFGPAITVLQANWTHKWHKTNQNSRNYILSQSKCIWKLFMMGVWKYTIKILYYSILQ